MRYWLLKCSLCLLFVFLVLSLVVAQTGKITIDLQNDKPTKYKTKVLTSEKTGEKKFTLPRKLIANTLSHYNYYFNANNKINEVIERARLGNNEVYYKLLPFYSYSLQNTSAQAAELDSVIYKATAGVLLHDLRSAWVDNFYLLIGKAYLLKSAFDSASMTFQFINYNLYPKKKDDEQTIVGSNVNNSGSNISIANKEDNNFVTRAFSRPPSRNDALVWQIRTLIEMKEYSDAAGLINTLRNDVNFPSRLTPGLEEVTAYWFYVQGIYDSAAVHLENALPNAADMQERARSEYLLAQLYQLIRNSEKAAEYYNKAIRHTTDPLLDIYANLSAAKMHDSSVVNEIDRSISHLVRMARRDKFETYRDIIYYSAGELALEKPDTAAAEFYIKKSVSYNGTNVSFRNKAFLKLAEINFARKNYRDAASYYDSLQVGDSTLTDIDLISEKKQVLSKIVYQITIIEREDSLQKIAAMAPAEREAFIKSLAKKLRKQRGIRDENATLPPSSVFENKNMPSDIFASSNTKGDWYFYNASVKAKGYTEFVSRWGKRQNIDNWRTLSASESPDNTINGNTVAAGIDSSGDVDAVGVSSATAPGGAAAASDEISYDGLLENVPTTTEKLDASNTLLSNAIFELGKIFQSGLEDYKTAVETYEESLRRFPDSLYGGELYMNLWYCYQKLGDMAKANYYKNLVTGKFAGSKFADIIKNPRAAAKAAKDPEVTKRYEGIYNLFIEGQFQRALEEKRAADSVYGNNYWTPQLLYIESVYYIKQREDSLAINVLNDIVSTYSTSLLKDKAETMIDVLRRRAEIEGYLTNLTIERAKDDETVVVDDRPLPQTPKAEAPVVKKDTVQQDTIAPADIPAKRDSIAALQKPENVPPVDIPADTTAIVQEQDNTPAMDTAAAMQQENTPAIDTAAVVQEQDSPPVNVPDTIAVEQEKVTPATIDSVAAVQKQEDIAANIPAAVDSTPVEQKQEPPVNIPVSKDSTPTAQQQNIPPVSVPAKKDSTPVQKQENVPPANIPARRDSTPPAIAGNTFNFAPTTPQFVVMVLDKVDPVYISEARNAFVRYNREKFSGQNIEIVREVIDQEKNLLVFRQFRDALTATAYADKIKSDAALEVSWLPANKYSFFIISDANLQVLKANKDFAGYLKILRQAMPGKF